MYLLYYLLSINFISAIFFYSDKKKAIKNKQRIPEKILHWFELLGGVFSIITLMYIIRHKNNKLKYYWITYLLLVMWIVALVCLYLGIINFNI